LTFFGKNETKLGQLFMSYPFLTAFLDLRTGT